ncbi:(deoxy)nucleoside triphosphate pyrophosphohydrolase [bacterium]|nr:(deoxy)nucleoside triphosphate pyrophosphohydrolase [bacterium]
MDIIEVVCAIFLNDKGEFLVFERGDNMSFSRLFEFPGGKVEALETKEEALKREIKEELQSEIRIKSYFTSVVHTYTKTKINREMTINLNAYFVELTSGSLTLTEHKSKRWIRIDDADSINLAYADKIIVERLKNYLNKDKKL